MQLAQTQYLLRYTCPEKKKPQYGNLYPGLFDTKTRNEVEAVCGF